MALSEEMIEAVVANDVSAVERLLDAGQDINACNEQAETAFSFACANDSFAVAKALHARGAEINNVDAGGGSPLDWAVYWASPEFRAWLKSVGAVRNDESYPEHPWPR